MRKTLVRAYMSSANLGPGFDVLAVALDPFYDEIEIRVVGEGLNKISLKVGGEHGSQVPVGEDNAVLAPIERALALSGEKLQLEVMLLKGVPPGKGLGSSGASSAAAARAMNEILGNVFSDDELISIAGEGERKVSGEPHYDNVSASLLGGFVLVSPGEGVRASRIPGGEGFSFLLAIPEIQVPSKKTGLARSVVPRQISLANHIANTSRLAKLILGIVTNNPKLAGEGMMDTIIEPAREESGLIPLYTEVKKEALKAGAYGVAVSGAGPSILILADKGIHERLRDTVSEIYARRGYRARLVSASPAPGALVLTEH